MKNFRNNCSNNHHFMVFLLALIALATIFNTNAKASKKRWTLEEDIILSKSKFEKGTNEEGIWDNASRELKEKFNVDRSYGACAKRFHRNIKYNNLLNCHTDWNSEKDQMLSTYVEDHDCEFDMTELYDLGSMFNENPMFLVERSRRHCGLDTRVMYNGNNIYGNTVAKCDFPQNDELEAYHESQDDNDDNIAPLLFPNFPADNFLLNIYKK